MSDFDQSRIAELVTRMVVESHGFVAHHQAETVLLPDLSLTIAVAEPIWHQDGRLVQLPIGIGDPTWTTLAWDQSVGVATDSAHPVAEALMAWVHHVLPLFIALRAPDHPLTKSIYRYGTRDAASKPAEILAGPIMWRVFGQPPTTFEEVLTGDPPTMLVAERVLADNVLTAQPTWLYTMSGRSGRSVVREVTLNNTLATDDFPGFDAALDWGAATGTVKSWMVLRSKVYGDD